MGYARFQLQVTLVHNEQSEVSLVHDMPTGPYLCLYQILKKYFKPLWSAQEFGLEIPSGEITRKKNKAKVVLLACNTPT